MAEKLQKQLFKAKVKDFGKSLGIDSSKPRDDIGISRIFGGEAKDDVDDFADNSPAGLFADVPPNFPALLPIVYVDLDILSDAARPVLNKIYAISIMVFFASIANVAVSIYRFADGVGTVVPLLFSILTAPLLWALQTFALDLSFRGAYRTDRRIMQRYLVIGVINFAILATYSFGNFLHFHGWIRLVSAKFRKRTLMMYVSCLEAMFWTVITCVQIHALLSYREFRSAHVMGLSSNAQPPKRGTPRQPEEAPPDPRKQAIEDIKARYANK